MGTGMLHVTCDRRGDVTVVELIGRLGVSAGDPELVALRSTIAALAAEGRVLVVLRLAQLESIDARGVGELAQTYKTLRAAGGGLMLVGARRAVKKLLTVARLDTILPMCDSNVDTTRWLRTDPVVSASRPPRQIHPNRKDACSRPGHDAREAR